MDTVAEVEVDWDDCERELGVEVLGAVAAVAVAVAVERVSGMIQSHGYQKTGRIYSGFCAQQCRGAHCAFGNNSIAYWYQDFWKDEGLPRSEGEGSRPRPGDMSKINRLNKSGSKYLCQLNSIHEIVLFDSTSKTNPICLDM